MLIRPNYDDGPATPPACTTAASARAPVAAVPDLDVLWGITVGDPRICVAVLDGPVDQTHPSFAGAELRRVETVVPHSSDGGPALRHGTHVASIIFGQHAAGPVRGLAPACRGLIVPIFADGPDGIVRHCSQTDLARAIILAVTQGAHVINVSAGQFSPSGNAHPILAGAVKNCADKGALIVSATGNDGCECLHVPGVLPSVLGVGAMNATGEPMPFSNWGSAYRTQGILAPGDQILGAIPGGGVAAHSGTSTSTAIVSGVAALLLSVQLEYGRIPNTNAVRKAILASAIGCDKQPVSDCSHVLAGRLSVKGALAWLLQGELDMSEDVAGPPIPESSPTQSTSEVREPQSVVLEPSSAILDTGSRMLPSGCPAEAASTMRFAKNTQPPVANQGSVTASAVQPSACACGGSGGSGGGPPPLVFALGTLNYDHGTETRRESIMAHMRQSNPNNY